MTMCRKWLNIKQGEILGDQLPKLWAEAAYNTYLLKQTNKQTKQTKKQQDMTVPFARARAKLGGSIR